MQTISDCRQVTYRQYYAYRRILTVNNVFLNVLVPQYLYSIYINNEFFILYHSPEPIHVKYRFKLRITSGQMSCSMSFSQHRESTLRISFYFYWAVECYDYLVCSQKKYYCTYIYMPVYIYIYNNIKS